MKIQCEWLNFEPSEYFNTLWGQLEYWLVGMLWEAEQRTWPRLPIYFCGATNAIALYLSHPSYSPFVKPFAWMSDKEPMKATWDYRQFLAGDRFMTTEEWVDHCKLYETVKFDSLVQSDDVDLEP